MALKTQQVSGLFIRFPRKNKNLEPETDEAHGRPADDLEAGVVSRQVVELARQTHVLETRRRQQNLWNLCS